MPELESRAKSRENSSKMTKKDRKGPEISVFTPSTMSRS